MKTVRFASVVEKAGHPEPYTLWMAPEKDAHFQSALKGHRVVTVHQETRGGKKDYGEVGLHKGGNLLVFPKSVKSFEGARIVGVKYDLLEPESEAPRAKKSEKQPKKLMPQARKREAAAKGEEPKERPSFPPLRVFEPEKEKPEAAPERVQGKKQTVPKRKPDADERKESVAADDELKALQREVKKAMKKLEGGNAVGAYQILERAMR